MSAAAAQGRAPLLSGLDLERMLGVEIGPLDRPILRRDLGWRALFADHADTAALRAKYADDAGVRTEALAAIDLVWDAERGLDRLLEAHGPADYVVASHVVEHVPDLLGWLSALRRVLRPGGEIRLVVPDKRFCFDCHRAESTLADVLAAAVARPTAPPLPRIADQFLHVVEADAAAIWAGRPPPPPVVDAGRWRWAEGVCRAVLASGRYQDVHCWVFTPARFCRLMGELCAFGALDLGCSLFRDTEPDGLEFLVGLRRPAAAGPAADPAADPAAAVAGWQAAAARALAALPP